MPILPIPALTAFPGLAAAAFIAVPMFAPPVLALPACPAQTASVCEMVLDPGDGALHPVSLDPLVPEPATPPAARGRPLAGQGVAQGIAPPPRPDHLLRRREGMAGDSVNGLPPRHVTRPGARPARPGAPGP